MMQAGNTEATIRKAEPRKPPANVIVPQKKSEKWDTQIDGLVVDMDIVAQRTSDIQLRLIQLEATIRAAVRWNTIRDIIMILIAVLITAMVGFNTMNLWGWN
jgi:hypothetical protein